MKLSRLTVISSLVLQITLSFSPYIPYIKGFIPTDDQVGYFVFLTTFVGIQFTLLTTSVILMILEEQGTINSLMTSIDNKDAGHIIKRIASHEFYNDFLAHAKNAKSTVNISYFAPYPPQHIPDADRKKYYDEITKLIKKKNNVAFKRMIRNSEANNIWIINLINRLEGLPNAHLSLLRKDVPEDIAMPLSLSTQIIDDEHVWIVATRSHELEGQFRDLYIKSRDAAIVINQYYNRVWEIADALVASGVVTTLGNQIRNTK